jgi:hypothetical protein
MEDLAGLLAVPPSDISAKLANCNTEGRLTEDDANGSSSGKCLATAPMIESLCAVLNAFRKSTLMNNLPLSEFSW